MSRRVLKSCSVLSLTLALLAMPPGFANAQPRPGGDGLPPPPPPAIEEPDSDLPDDSEDVAPPDDDLGITEDSILEGMLDKFPCEAVARSKGKKLFSNIKRARSYFNKFARLAGLERDAIDWDYIKEEAQSYVEFCRNGGDEDEGDDDSDSED